MWHQSSCASPSSSGATPGATRWLPRSSSKTTSDRSSGSTKAGAVALPVALLALAVGAFGIGTTEFVMMGLLPEVATAFDVPIPTAGYLISGYALGVVVGAPLLTAASVRWPRRTVLIALMALFAAGNVLAALAPSYGTLLAARVLTGLPHGAFFGTGSVVAARPVLPQRRAPAPFH